jgi:hypothetical protein
MRVLLFLLLLLCCVFGSDWLDCSMCDGSLLKRMCLNCMVQCQLRVDHSQIVAKQLASQVFGQESAVRIISDALYRFDLDPRGPLAFHIAGDNGVGKTLAATVIGESRFSVVGADLMPDGLLYLRGELFVGDGDNRTAHFRDEIARSIVSLLSRCPDALIVFDEVEKVHRTTLQVLEAFLDSTVPSVNFHGVKVRTDRAVFILISDFGRADVTSNITVDEQKTLIEEVSRKIWKRMKVSDVIDHIVPFRPLDQVALEAIAQKFINDLPKRDVFRANNVRRVDAARDLVPKLCKQSQSDANGANARALIRLMRDKVDTAASLALETLETKRRANIASTTYFTRIKSMFDLQHYQQPTVEYELRLTVDHRHADSFEVLAKLVEVRHTHLRNEL